MNIMNDIVEKYDTPIYIYEKNKIDMQIKKLQHCLPEDVNILYSVKANPNVHLLSAIYENVYGVEVSSMGELYLAIQAKIDVNKIVFVGPAKTDEELAFAIRKRIYLIVAESINETKRINMIAKQLNVIVNIALRINPQKDILHTSMRMGGGPKQFGVDEEKMLQIYRDITKLKNVKIIGIHCYLGTQNLDQAALIRTFETVIEIAIKLQTGVNSKLEFIDLGGGFGIPVHEEEKELDLLGFKEKFAFTFQQNKKYFLDSCQFFVESGRFIIGPAGSFICKVIDKKESRGKNFLLVDGGTNCGPTSYTNGRFLRKNPLITVLGKRKSSVTFITDIVGPLCTPTDFLAQNICFPFEVNIGDYLLIKNAGAYGYSAASKDFLSHFYPEEILINSESVELIRKKSCLENLLDFF